MISARNLLALAAAGLLIAPGLAAAAQNAPRPQSLDNAIFGGNSATPEPLTFVSTIFGDNMVLQRGKPDTIWGWS